MKFRQTTVRGALLSEQRKRLVCLKGPSLGYVRARSLLRQVPQLQLGTPVSENTTRKLQTSSTAAGIPAPDKTSPPATRKVHPRAFIVDDFDKYVIRRKSKNFTRSGSSSPSLTGYLQFHYVNVSVLIKFLQKQTQRFYLDYHKFSKKAYVLDVYYNRLSEAILIHSTTYVFMEKYRNFSLFIILIPTPDIPYFYYMLGGNLGSLLYGDVSGMSVQK